MDIDITKTGDTDILFTNDIKINAKHILDSEAGEFKNYPLLYLGKSYFINKKARDGFDELKIKQALDYDNIKLKDIKIDEV